MTSGHLLLLVAINAAWGLNFLAGKIGTADFGPLTFSAIRFAVVLLLLFPFIRRVPGQMKDIIFIGLLLGGGHYSIMFLALHVGENISSVAIATQLTVPFSTLLAVVFLKERVAIVRVVSIAIAFLGVVIIGFEPIGSQHILSLSLTALASLAMAIAAILMRRLNKVGVFNLQAWIALVSTLVLTLLAFAFEAPDFSKWQTLPLQTWWTPVYSAIGATIFGHGSLYYLLQRYPVNQIAPFITLATLFAIAFSLLWMDDTMTWKIAIGGLLTLVGVTIIALRNARKSTPSSLRVPR